jgi:pimeloyl-ACP methyl ester carboxylesterase
MDPSIAQEGNEAAVGRRQASGRRRWLRILKRVVIAVVIIVVVLVYGVFPYWFAVQVTNARTRSGDLKLTETPADFGAQFRDVEFTTSDGVRISAWLLPAGDRRATIVYSHGLFRSRRELLARAVELWRAGYGALLYDSRNHGASGEARVSAGYNERLDAEAAVRYLREQVSGQDRIVLFGISMGAAAALLAAAETPEVAAVISDSSFLSFDDTAAHHISVFLHLPAFPLANIVVFFIEQRAGFDSSKLDALGAVRGLGGRAAMFIAAANDRRMPPAIAHGHAFQANPQLYITRVTQFLESALSD